MSSVTTSVIPELTTTLATHILSNASNADSLPSGYVRTHPIKVYYDEVVGPLLTITDESQWQTVQLTGTATLTPSPVDLVTTTIRGTPDGSDERFVYLTVTGYPTDAASPRVATWTIPTEDVSSLAASIKSRLQGLSKETKKLSGIEQYYKDMETRKEEAKKERERKKKAHQKDWSLDMEDMSVGQFLKVIFGGIGEVVKGFFDPEPEQYYCCEYYAQAMWCKSYCWRSDLVDAYDENGDWTLVRGRPQEE